MLKTIRMMLIVAMLSSIATYAFAEDPAAPVYDADSMPSSGTGDSSSSDVDQQMSPPDSPAPSRPSHAEVQVTPQPDVAPAIKSTTVQAEQQPFVPLQSLTLDQRVRKVEQQVNNLQSSGTAGKVEELQTEVQTLRGQLDDVTHQLHELQQKQTEQQTAAASLDKRMNKIAEAKPETTATPVLKTDESASTKTASSISDADKSVSKTTTKADEDSTQPNIAEEQATYQTAYDLIKAKKYNDAITALQKMLQKYPSGQSAANAHYWLGELYGLTGKNDQSAAEFSTIIKNFPQSSKVADAELKVGLIYATQQKWPDAKSAFKKVTKNYPGTTSARLAQEQLKQIKQAGH